MLDKIKKSLLLCNPYEKTEIEIKFSTYGQSFSSITHIQMKRLLNHLNITDKRLTTYYINDHTRKIITTFEQEEIIIEHYKNINYIYDENYQLHCFITQLSEANDEEYTIIKEKIEYYFAFDKCNLIVSETVSENITTYEAVLKFNIDLLDESWMNDVDIIIKNIILILNDTKVLYTEPERLKMVNDFNKCFVNKNTNEKYIKNILNQPLPIQLQNLEFNEPYIISTKAKGKRKMLIIHRTGVWLVSNQDYNLLTNVQNKLTQAWHLTVFDGDIIKPLNYNEYEFNYEYWYLAYDCLCFDSQDLRHKQYIDRIDIAKTFSSLVTSYITTEYLKFSLKTTRVALYKEEIIENIRYLLNLQEVINYDHNGLIFTPAYRGYNDPVYKWTIPSMTTIDFAVYDTGERDKINLYVYDEKTKKDIPFTNLNVFDETMIYQEPFIKYKNKKYIAECNWNTELEKMVLIKIRDDKEQADSVEMVLDNWKNINNPLIDSNCYYDI